MAYTIPPPLYTLQNRKTNFKHATCSYVDSLSQLLETNLLTLSNNVYLMFYAKKVDLGT